MVFVTQSKHLHRNTVQVLFLESRLLEFHLGEQPKLVCNRNMEQMLLLPFQYA